jgi:hypothetical protein
MFRTCRIAKKMEPKAISTLSLGMKILRLVPLAGAIGIAICLSTVSLRAQTFWTGSNITYTHTSADAADPLNPASADQITAGVWITRATSLGIFNSVSQTSYGAQGTPGSGTPEGSPSDTEWAIGSTFDTNSLSFGSWDAVLHGSQGVGQQAVLHLINENIYISIEFTSFANDGTYTYVRSTPPVAAPPTVTITNPAPGAVFPAPATIPIGAMASVSGGSVTNVSFFTNAVLAGASTAAPFGVTLTGVHVGAYALTAVATADDGLSATSSVVNISVEPPPSVSITNPATGSVYAAPANVSIAASATVVKGSITNVQFFANSVSLGSVPAAPFTLTANGLAAGSYALTASATAAGLTTTSSPVNINVETPVAVALGDSTAFSGTNFQFNYSANVGLSYVVQRTTNIVSPNWVAIATNVAASNPTNFVDKNATNNPAFYRVGRLPNP